MSGASLAVAIDKVEKGSRATLSDEVAVEEPLEIQLCAASAEAAAARSVSITMRTPGDDIDLALGFLFTESIISGYDDVESAGQVGEADPETGLRNTVRVELAPGVDVDPEKLKRHFYTTSSCGVCGKASLDALQAIRPKKAIADTFEIGRDTLVGLPARLRAEQATFETTGGLHAAAAFTADGELVCVREDVGRHNAVDKVIGSLLAAGRIPAADLGLMVSGRASFELMQKTLMAGIPMLAAVSAPSSLAVRLAQDYGLTLVGFLRGPSFNIYSAARRIVTDQGQ